MSTSSPRPADLDTAIASRYASAQVLSASSRGSTRIGIAQETGQRVVIKTCLLKSFPPGFLMRLHHEAMVLSQTECEYYNSPIEVVRTEEALHIVFPFVRGISLDKRLKSHRAEVTEAIDLGICLFSALRDLHNNRVFHRGVRPENIIVNTGREITEGVLVDLQGASPISTSSNELDKFLKEARYFAPELAGSIDHDITASSDLYSAGIVLFECLAGYPPFSGSDLHSLLFNHMTAGVPELRSLGRAVPRALDEVIQRLLRKDPRNRYQSADAALQDLLAIQASLAEGIEEPKVVIGGFDSRSSLIEPAFVSRDKELAVFDELIESASLGKSGLALLEGESGGGKSRLLAEVAHRAAKRGFRVLRGVGSNHVVQYPFHVLDGVIERFAADCKLSPDYAEHVRKILDQDAEIVSAAFPLMAQWLGTPTFPESAPELTGEMRTIRALSTFLTALGTEETPALIVLDDCQWAGELTYKLIKYWQSQNQAQGPTHVLIVVAFRSEEVGPGHLLRRIPASTQLELSPFDAEEIRQLAESMAGRLPDAALDIIAQLGGGSPFMASAVLHGLVESGALIYEEDQWRIDPLAIGSIHSSDREATFLTRRLDLLSEEVLEYLTAGAVIGNQFDMQMAATLADLPPAEAIAAVDVARQRQLVWCRPDGVTCVFMHDKIRHALLERRSAGARRELHLRAARYFQKQQNARISELAYHFDAAGASELAFEYALEAAELARSRHALDVAEQQYKIARRGAPIDDEDVQYRVAAGLGDVLMLRGKYDAAGELFAEANRYASGRLTKAQIRGKLAELAFKRGDMEGAVADYEAALRSFDRWIPTNRFWLCLWLIWEVLVQIAHSYFPKLFVHRIKTAPSEADRLTIRLYSGLAHGSWYSKGSLNTLWAHLRGLNLAERFPPTLELGNAYSEHAPVMSLLGRFSRAIRYAQKSLAIRRELGDLWGQGQSLHYYGVVLYAASRYVECIHRCRESIRLLERMGDYWHVHVARYQIAASYYRLGNLSAAIEESKKNRLSGLELGDDQASGIILDVWARAAHGAVPQEILEAEIGRDRHDPQGQAQVLFAAGVCQLSQNQVESASRLFHQALDIVRRAGVRNGYTLPMAAWAVTALRRSVELLDDYTPNRRRRLIRKAGRMALAARLSCWHCKNDVPHVLREEALIYSMKGRSKAAFRCINKSLKLARKQQARYEFAQSMIAKTKIGREFGWPIDEQEVQTARAILAELEVPHEQIALWKTDEGSAASLSLVDRFETVLESGRKIATGLSESVIYQEFCAAVCRLLRVHHGVVLKAAEDRPPNAWTPVAGRREWEIESGLIENAFAARRAVASSGEHPAGGGSELCVPLYLRGKPVACLSVVHPEIRGLFGQDEERLADFLATIAGAALENAEGFAELQELNATLERRVAERTAVVEARSRELAASNGELERIAHELRQAQVELSASKQAAEAASEAKSRFLATMSHEIRTPMNGILGMAELVLGSYLSDRQRGYLETLKDSANALLNLLNDLLDFSKIEAGKMELESIPFLLRDAVVDSARVLAVTAGRKNLNLVTRIEPDVPAEVVGDPNRLRQVLVNLVGNAIKFTPRGEVSIHVSVQSQTESEALIRLSIRDTGIGIPKNKREWIFEAFHQTDSSVTRRFGGTGLGLAISSQLIQLMYGTIQLESEEGLGAVFDVDIPCPLPESIEPPPPLDLGERSIVILSDHSESELAVREMLEFLGVQAASADAISKDQPRPVLIADLSVDSGELMDQVTRELYDGGILPDDLVCLIPAGRSEILNGCEALEIEQILTKPVKPRELAQALQSVAGRRSPAAGTASPFDSGPCSLEVLVADDSAVNREVAIGMLEMCGHHVRTAANGTEALEALKEHDFDLVFMDLEMPVMDGFAATRAIRRLPGEKSQVPIYAMTAHALSETDQKCREAGMDGFITKPIMPGELMELLNRATASKSNPLCQP